MHIDVNILDRLLTALSRAQAAVFAAEKLVTTAESHPAPKAKTWAGMKIMVENPKGSVRTGKNENGESWRTEMKYDYGYIHGTTGADDEGLDVYLGPAESSPVVYIVHQNDPKTGEYDEDKCMLGFSSPEEAKKAYLAHYDDPKFFGDMEEMSMGEFKKEHNILSRKKSKYKKAA